MASSSSVSSHPTAQNLNALLPKFYESDPDFRYMGLSDMFSMLSGASPGVLLNDFTTAAKILDGLIATLKDSNGEVQNMAIKCLTPFVNRAPEAVLAPMIDKVSQLNTDAVVDISIPCLALRTIVVSFPRPQPGVPPPPAVRDAYRSISMALMPRLVGYAPIPPREKGLVPPPPGMIDVDLQNGTDSNALDVLTELARCFGPMLADIETRALQNKVFDVLESDRAGSVLKKKAVTAVSALAPFFTDVLLSQTLSKMIESFRQPHLPPSKRKLYFTILASMARSIPRKFGPHLKTLAPFVLSALSETELDEDMAGSVDLEERDPEADEVRDAALAALESFTACCVDDMRLYTGEVIGAALRFLKYDPNLASGDDDDDDDMEEEDDDELEGEDFEEDTGFDDEDDSSWKIRRSAAKVLSALIATRCDGDLLEEGTMYSQIAPALVSRFKEREESVRLEVLAALSLLIRNTGVHGPELDTSLASPTSMGPPSRKRRRGSSDTSVLDSQAGAFLSNGHAAPGRVSTPPVGPRASLSKLSPDLVRGVASLFKSSPLPTRQASIMLLKDLVKARRGGLENCLDLAIEPVVEAAKTQATGVSSSSSSTSANTYRIQALQFLGAAFELHPSAALQPQLKKTLPAVVSAARDRYSKVSVEAICTIEQLVKSICPPRNETPSPADRESLQQLYGVVEDRISATDADTEVRQQAVRALGLLLGLSSGDESLIAKPTRKKGLGLLEARLKNELTQLASVRAVETVGLLAKSSDEFEPRWVRGVAVTLGSQLRKAMRSLRGASLSALRVLCTNSATARHLDSATIQAIVGLVEPLLREPQVDLHMLGPALVTLTALVKIDAKTVLDGDFISSFTLILNKDTDISGHTLEFVLGFVQAVGQAGAGQRLMDALLAIGIGGNLDLNGRLIGSLLVASQSYIKQKLEAFVHELKQHGKDDRRCNLALTVLGEAALRMGPSSPLQPAMFMQYFKGASDKVPLTAALALGRAGSGNINAYLPAILQAAKADSTQNYLLLHGIREILQHAEAEPEILPYADQLWDTLIAASQVEDNKAIAAECVGRLAVVDPKTYLPQLQAFLRDSNKQTRGMVISALRFTFADSDSAFDEYLKPILIPTLTAMLNEQDLENRRLALSTLNAAAHSKPALVLPHLDELLPLAVEGTIKREDLIKQVKVGPFVTTVDEGLDLRKSAYQTLYSFLDTAPLSSAARPTSTTATNLATIADRTVDGLNDHHDIRMLCLLMLSKLVDLAPEDVYARLEALCTHFKTVLETRPKDSAVKQELEKLHEAQRGVVKAGLLMSRRWVVVVAPPPPSAALGEDSGQGPQLKAWEAFWSGVKKQHPALVKAAEDELREKDR